MEHTEILPSAGLSINEKTIRDSAEALIKHSREIVIQSQQDMESAATAARQLKAIAKKIEDIRVARVAPLNEEVAVINHRLKKGMIDPLKEAAKEMEMRMLAYTREQAALAAAEEKRRQEADRQAQFDAILHAQDATDDELAVDWKPVEAETTAVAVPQITRSLDGAVGSMRCTWTWELVDITALAGADPSLVMVNHTAVNALIKDGVRTIPGLRIYQEEKMVVR